MIAANRTVKILLVYLFTANMGASLFAPVFAVFITQTIVGATLATVGFSLAIYSFTKSVIQIPLAKFLDRTSGEMDEFYAMIIGSITGVLYMFGLVLTNQVWQLYMLAVLSGAADACLMAAYYAVFSHHIDKKSQGFEWSLLSVIGLSASVAIGGALGGLLADQVGFQRLFLIAGMISLVATLLLILLYPHIKRSKRK